jgi:glycosyltransferase involved in cell wall biosynthesis
MQCRFLSRPGALGAPSLSDATDARRRTAYIIGPGGDGTRTRGSRGPLPYGAHLLANLGYSVTYIDTSANRALRLPFVRLFLRTVHRFAHGPVLAPVLEPRRVLQADLVVCIFEDNLPVLARLLRLRSLLRRGQNVLLVCWLAQTLAESTAQQRRRWRRRLTAFDRVLVFSSNQVQLLTDALDLPDGLVGSVPFGVAVPDLIARSSANRVDEDESNLILSVGNDVGRDYQTFVEAVAAIDAPATIITNVLHARGLPAEPGVDVIGPVQREEYLSFVERAAVVVSPTHPLPYPTGQTVLLEAMAMGKSCVVTRSSALDDYVSDGVDVLLVPPHNAVALRGAIQRLQHDAEQRRRLGSNARRRAQQFSENAMWTAVVEAADPEVRSGWREVNHD